LRFKIPLSIIENEPTFLTIENCVHMQEKHWKNDHHNYIHEGIRVFLSRLLNMHCYTSARLQEICLAKYQDLLCMVGWKDGEPDIKLGFKRDLAKGMRDTPKKEFHAMWDVLTTIRPPLGEKYRILEWADDVLGDPVFPEMSENGPIPQTRPTFKDKNKDAWGHQCSDWAKRANFLEGIGLHAARREELIKVNDGGYSLSQVMKFTGHRNSKTLVGHYLDDISNVGGAAAYLGLEPRRDVTEDFRSASMGWNPGLLRSLPARVVEESKQRQDYIELREQVEVLSLGIKTAVTEEAREEQKIQLSRTYYRLRRLRDMELEKYKKGQPRVYDTQCETYDEGDWRRSYFDRVVRHMIPERDRLADTLVLAVPLRSPEGISALEDLIALLKNDSRVAY
ncbi:hypothetical protein B0T14DRAFT_413287, partial [Immersiella caudata]